MKALCMDVSGGPPEGLSLHGRRILVVEDEILIALTAQDMLTDAGAAEIVIATRVGEATSHLSASAAFDGAVIDLNLGGGFDFSLASIALDCGIPFVLATGYGRAVVLPAALANIQIVTKPYTADTLVAALCEAIRVARPSDR